MFIAILFIFFTILPFFLLLRQSIKHFPLLIILSSFFFSLWITVTGEEFSYLQFIRILQNSDIWFNFKQHLSNCFIFHSKIKIPASFLQGSICTSTYFLSDLVDICEQNRVFREFGLKDNISFSLSVVVFLIGILLYLTNQFRMGLFSLLFSQILIFRFVNENKQTIHFGIGFYLILLGSLLGLIRFSVWKNAGKN
ncbi:hypothetical protein M0811_02165 [Anaeramoeba ignava]|uniref:Uncharacterized protein n=1 Tax=Anaeramoeba ignava TaxID=1746090 RepID=A0A9Q0LBW5_ANAIG|nr:hypothetical protein M0811_02165 [Anaeramoeba ignava]